VSPAGVEPALAT